MGRTFRCSDASAENNLFEMWVCTLPCLARPLIGFVDGAALFYTSQQPMTLVALRQYILHFLFMPPPPPADSPPLKYKFAFSQRPNTLDRDRILVPAGWDSWGKISVLRDGFDAARWGEAWERDMESDGAVPGGARVMFALLVGEDESTKVGYTSLQPPTMAEEISRNNLFRHSSSRSQSSHSWHSTMRVCLKTVILASSSVNPWRRIPP